MQWSHSLMESKRNNCCNNPFDIVRNGFITCINCGMVKNDIVFDYEDQRKPNAQYQKLLGTVMTSIKKVDATPSRFVTLYRIKKLNSYNCNEHVYMKFLCRLQTFYDLNNNIVNNSIYFYNKILHDNPKFKFKSVLSVTCLYISMVKYGRHVKLNDLVETCKLMKKTIKVKKIIEYKNMFKRYWGTVIITPNDYLIPAIEQMKRNKKFQSRILRYNTNVPDFLNMVTQTTELILENIEIKTGCFPKVICGSTIYYVSILIKELNSRFVLTQDIIASAVNTTPVSLRKGMKLISNNLCKKARDLVIDRIKLICSA